MCVYIYISNVCWGWGGRGHWGGGAAIYTASGGVGGGEYCLYHAGGVGVRRVDICTVLGVGLNLKGYQGTNLCCRHLRLVYTHIQS